jgi:cell division protein FtsQ
MIAGCVEFMGEYMYFDKDGIVVEGSAKRLKDVPVIKGLEFSKLILSEKIKLVDHKNTVTETEEEASKDTKKQKDQEAEKITQEQKTEEALTDELFDVIINLTQLIDKYELPVDTITFNKNYEVSLDCGDITVLLGEKSTYDEALSELKNILAKSSGRKIIIDISKGINNIIGTPKRPTN